MSCADFRGWIDGAQRQSMTSVGEVTAEEEREKFLCTQPESNRQPLAYETRTVPQDHCQCTDCFVIISCQIHEKKGSFSAVLDSVEGKPLCVIFIFEAAYHFYSKFAI
jgi:hypothetical protein